MVRLVLDHDFYEKGAKTAEEIVHKLHGPDKKGTCKKK